MGSTNFKDSGEEFLQKIVWQEEDFTTAGWDGGYRWFRSPNVVCFERYRRREEADVILRSGR